MISESLAHSILSLYFLGEDIPNIADNTATTPFTEMEIALHTAEPIGDQSSNECTYTSYARVTRNRSSSDWTVTANECNPNTVISAPSSTDTNTEIITHWSIGVGGNLTNPIDYSGTVTPNIEVTTGVTPQLSIDTVIRMS